MIQRRILLLFALVIVVTIGTRCGGRVDEHAPQSTPDTTARVGADRSLVSIAVISLDPQGWDDVRAFIQDLPSPTIVKIFYGDGNVVVGSNVTAMRLLDSLSKHESLSHTDVPATLPYFSTALIAAIGASLETSCEHTRTVVLGTFPPLKVRSRREIERIGPIITRTELESLAKLPDHRFIVIGPSDASVLRDMMLRALAEAKSRVTSISYQSGVQ
ncbi:MAG: hypothetical protein JSS89_05610 [Bacteroidetes bacterium]|nr:hypothetical protein [Bacteroidota bacterium]